MSLPAIEVTGLSKRYVIEHESRHDNLRDTLHHTARKLWRRVRWGTGFEREEFWALREVSFSVQPGEVVGIIGRNGAGKSTLLKVLSRITEPTAGTVRLRGRVASLLEVGTGFHPDLSGRENIYLNGAILGMSRLEIRRKFDEIVAFAEVERFLDTPVKRYSSGMYVRLAFAVAAHLEPEILIVDEVLAVGDAQFQNKCLGKISQVTREHGRTVLLVSHNMDAILRLCRSALVLAQGRLAFQGDPVTAVAHYAQTHAQMTHVIDCGPAIRPAWARGRIVVERLIHLDTAAPPWSVTFGGELAFACEAVIREPKEGWHLFVALFSSTGVEVAAFRSPTITLSKETKRVVIQGRCSGFRLTPGSYVMNVGLQSGGEMQDMLTEITRITVLPNADSAAQHADSFRGFYVPVTSFEVR